MFLDSGNPGKTCNSKIKLGPCKTELFLHKNDMIHTLEWPFGTRIQTPKILSPCYILAKGDKYETSFWNASALKMLFCTLIGVILLHQTPKNSPDVNTLPAYNTTFFQLPRQWTGPSETSIWNTSPMKMLLGILIGVIIRSCKRIQTPKNSCSCKHPSWIQVYILTTPKPVNRPIWNLDLKYFTSTDDILYAHSFDPFLSTHTNSWKLAPQ